MTIAHSVPPESTNAQITTIEVVSEQIRVRGTVQGVGFRPTVYRLAQRYHLRGEVCNDGEGVLIRVTGPQTDINTFIEHLQQNCPPLARIESIDRHPLSHPLPHQKFTIAPSLSGTIQTSISPDAATCPDCVAEIFDPLSRWYRYPFTNCTHCGPRLSILRSIPYDRSQTSMAVFAMCSDCQQDYETVSDRRFHAQPIACHRCGPKAWLERADGKPITAAMFSMLDDVDAVCTLLQKGHIVAIKGIGGFHLACDATNEVAVQTLRQRKQRYLKPFALMARDLAIIEQYCDVTDSDRQHLTSAIAPIVLMSRKPISVTPNIASSVAPDQTTLGFMLPYTPLHHLILRRMNRPIVLTSGNRSDEPQCIDNQEARQKLADIADYFLMHDRVIVNRVDDSVVRSLPSTIIGSQHATANQATQILRRARGYAPAPIRFPQGFESAPPLLAMGAELKNTFGLLKDGQAILSQHLGDLEHAAAFTGYQQTLNLYLQLFEHQPTTIAIDSHPDYLSTKLGEALANANQLPLQVIQHHHAHIAACMIDNHLPLDIQPILGVALDGLGYGDDHTLWGGEFLLADYQTSWRLGHVKPIALLGGAQAIYQPWRNTYAHLRAAIGWEELQRHYSDLELVKFLAQQPRSLFNQMLEQGLNAPLASSCGRLFDAVAAALDLCREASYEGQGAIALESLAEAFWEQETIGYPFAIVAGVLEPQPMWFALLEDLNQGLAKGAIAARFHRGLAQAIVQMVKLLSQQHSGNWCEAPAPSNTISETYQLPQVRSPRNWCNWLSQQANHTRFPTGLFTQVALTGGVFQNQLLLQQVHQGLTSLGFTVLTHHQVPTNDGSIALGQLAVSAARKLEFSGKEGGRPA